MVSPVTSDMYEKINSCWFIPNYYGIYCVAMSSGKTANFSRNIQLYNGTEYSKLTWKGNYWMGSSHLRRPFRKIAVCHKTRCLIICIDIGLLSSSTVFRTTAWVNDEMVSENCNHLAVKRCLLSSSTLSNVLSTADYHFGWETFIRMSDEPLA